MPDIDHDRWLTDVPVASIDALTELGLFTTAGVLRPAARVHVQAGVAHAYEVCRNLTGAPTPTTWQSFDGVGVCTRCFSPPVADWTSAAVAVTHLRAGGRDLSAIAAIGLLRLTGQVNATALDPASALLPDDDERLTGIAAVDSAVRAALDRRPELPAPTVDAVAVELAARVAAGRPANRAVLDPDLAAAARQRLGVLAGSPSRSHLTTERVVDHFILEIPSGPAHLHLALFDTVPESTATTLLAGWRAVRTLTGGLLVVTVDRWADPHHPADEAALPRPVSPADLDVVASLVGDGTCDLDEALSVLTRLSPTGL